MKRAFVITSGLVAAAFLAAGCGVENGTAPVPQSPLGLAVGFDMSRPQSEVSQDDIGIGRNIDPFADGSPDSVVVSSAVVMIRSIRLLETPVASVDTVITAADEERDRLDASVAFQGPYVVTPDGDGELAIVNVPSGNYQQVSFVLQKARFGDDLNGHDDLRGSSIRVTGRVWRNGVYRSFVYATDYTSEFVVNGNFRIGATENGSLALTFAAGKWFHNGSRWLDPERGTDAVAIVRSLRRNISGSLTVH